jgi:hypothetical protein
MTISQNNMDKFIYIYSVDTSSFYNDIEWELNQKLLEFKKYRSNLNEIIKPLNKIKIELNKIMKGGQSDSVEEGLGKIEKKFSKIIESYLMFETEINEYILFDDKSGLFKENPNSILFISEAYLKKYISTITNNLEKEAYNHKGKRKLRIESLTDSKKISLFESTLTRSLGAKEGEMSNDIIVIRAYRYVIFEDLIKNGFIFNNEKYEYFSSSAGQIRTKKSCFIRSDALNANKHEVRNKLMCGLSINKINKKGGINQNKFQAYLSLTNSASTKWENFNIDKCIVVDDMELKVKGLVDYIDHNTYGIERIEKDIPINFMDGAGIILPSLSVKSFQFRMPFFKGLLVPFNYDKYIDKYCNGKSVVKDIYNNEWDIIKDDIQIIFTKSQFKLNGYYSSWKEYRTYFKKFNCEASICKTEEKEFQDKPINYQMIQSLSFTDDELKELAANAIEEIEKLGTDKVTMLKILGADESNMRKNPFQKSIELYHSLINDVYSKEVIKDKKKSLVRDAKSGKIIIDGTKRTYISPDVFAFAEWLFSGVKEPKGLLQKNDVSCRLFDEKKLDLLRSPHLFREHCVRSNIRNKYTDEWFITNGVYTSIHDLISKQLMFDVDGDDSLIVSNDLFVRKAEDQMKDIVPLDYTLATAKKSRITNSNIVKSLKAAYSKNIGEISNLITRIWNSESPDLELIKFLCMENNAIIDFAKTLWMPERSEMINNKIKTYSNTKVPFFFQFAKNKEEENVEKINNSTMNRLVKLIPDKRIAFNKVIDDFDYRYLMNNKNHKLTKEDQEIINLYIYENKNKTKIIREQMKNQGDMLKKGIELQVYKEMRNKFLELGKSTVYITDVLIRYLYGEKNDKHKQTLWFLFGQEILRNVEWNVKGIKRCRSCNNEIESAQAKQYCKKCAEEKERARKREWKKNRKVAKIK